ncbi:DUF456 domain-containing protein [candidate division KSB1 bacterium]|nr:DUF456 domain-containing protein [candidate division KSB1 bacterium]
MTIFWVILGLAVSIVGFLGCILPVIPGPPLSFLALIILSIARNWQVFDPEFLWIMAGITFLVTVLDYVVPAWGAKRYGASRIGVWLSVVGMIIGLVLFPPWGMFFGALLGAVCGEVLSGKKSREAFKAGWGVFVGNLVGIGLKLAASGVMLFYYIRGMF